MIQESQRSGSPITVLVALIGSRKSMTPTVTHSGTLRFGLWPPHWRGISEVRTWLHGWVGGVCSDSSRHGPNDRFSHCRTTSLVRPETELSVVPRWFRSPFPSVEAQPTPLDLPKRQSPFPIGFSKLRMTGCWIPSGEDEPSHLEEKRCGPIRRIESSSLPFELNF